MSLRERVFQIHATTWFSVNVLLFVIWLVTGAGFPWFVIPAVAWGVPLAIHAVLTYGQPPRELEGRRYRELT
jgi:hypothetical protein